MNKVYACTDIHGMYNLWSQIRDYCDETDTIYFLGDACDRGSDGLKIIQEMLLDPRVIYLKGNHEDLFVNCASEIMGGYSSSSPLWVTNGGRPTINAFNKLSSHSQIWFITRLNKLKTSATYINKKQQTILLSHAGYNPDKEVLSDFDYLWDRNHIKEPFPKGEQYQNTYVVHGHTPVPYAALDLDIPVEIGEDGYWNILRYGNDDKEQRSHKIDLDLASVDSNKIALLDLDTLEPLYFYTK